MLNLQLACHFPMQITHCIMYAIKFKIIKSKCISNGKKVCVVVFAIS